jgi:iron complex transport system ATP-binding protein
MSGDPLIALEGVTVWRSSGGVRRAIVDDVTWQVHAGEHWAIVGPNGAGKTTLLRIAGAQMRPSAGTVSVLGGLFGDVQLPELRRRIGMIEPGLGRRFYPEQRLIDVVLTGVGGTILLPDEPLESDVAQAFALLASVGLGELANRTFVSCSEGERARALLARGLMADAPLILFDEPAAGLDLAGRELLLRTIAAVVAERRQLGTVTVTHHIEELPPTTTHALLLRDGGVVAQGAVADVLQDAPLGACFGLPLRVEEFAGRRFVRAAT